MTLFERRYSPPFTTTIPHQAEWQLANESWRHKLRENWRLFRRELWLWLSGQKRLEQQQIPVATQRILWFATATNNLGDAIMGFSGRYLLSHYYPVDVLLTSKVAPLFMNDTWFGNIYTDVKEVTGNYDLILLDTVKSITLKTKLRYFAKIPYCHLRGHFDGVEHNWILYNYHRINALLNYPLSQAQVDEQALPRLAALPPLAGAPALDLVIAVGGEDNSRRVYPQWLAVISTILQQKPHLTIGLVGNANGLATSEEIVTKLGNNVISYVNRLSLPETMQVIAHARLFVGCDGGLMHIASAFQRPGLALFGNFEAQFRLPLSSRLETIYDPETVSNIAPQLVLTRLLVLIDQLANLKA